MAGVSQVFAALRRLEGKVALITGAASGIGESTARLFMKHGSKVVIADIQDDLGHCVAKELGDDEATFIHCDVTKEEDIENAVKKTVSKHGKLDIMFNNAGISGEANPNILKNDKAEVEKVMSVNVIGPFLGTKHAAAVMIPNRRGSIINTASVSSLIGGIAPLAYTISKHGVVGLTRGTAAELGQYGIRVNCVSPYLVPTPMSRDFFQLDDDGFGSVFSTLKNALLQPQDVAEAALYLGGDESKYVSGQNLVVDGGFTVVNSPLSMFRN